MVSLHLYGTRLLFRKRGQKRRVGAYNAPYKLNILLRAQAIEAKGSMEHTALS